MKTLSPALLAAQQSASRVPYIKVTAGNRVHGMLRLDWERLYTGSEADYYHALAICGSGALVRVRLTPPADGRKLYRQAVPGPGPAADFSSWVYTGQYNGTRVAAAAAGNMVSLFWVNTSREIRRIVSSDSGANWGSPELIDQAPTTAAGGLAAAYKTNGDLALFFTDQATLYVKKLVNGSWQARAAWDQAAGNLSGAAAVYDGDWHLLITGQDAAGCPRVWSLAYGDGGTVPAGSWTPLCAVAAAPAGSAYSYDYPTLFRPDGYRGCFNEKYEGTVPYNQPLLAHPVPATPYAEGLWREPVPGDFEAPYGLAAGYHAPGEDAWLATPNGVWRARLVVQEIDVSADVIALEMAVGEEQDGLTAELDNHDYRYTDPAAPLVPGGQLAVAAGYRTAAGEESGGSYSFVLDSYELIRKDAANTVRLQAGGGWAQLKQWRARDQWRWNRAGPEKSVREILAFVLARAGLRLIVKSASPVISSFFPDFTIHPLDRGDLAVNRLLDLVPDRLIFGNGTACLVYPQAGDSPVYRYGEAHPIRESKYLRQGKPYNWVRVTGSTAGGGEITADFYNQADIREAGSRYLAVHDSNLQTPDQAAERGTMLLRRAGMKAAAGYLLVPANCGQELYDVVEIIDGRGFSGTGRVISLTMVYDPRQGQYLHRLGLGGV